MSQESSKKQMTSNFVKSSAGCGMSRTANYVPREPQIVIASSTALKIQAVAARVAFCTICKVKTELGNDFIEKKVTVLEVGYPEESEMPRSDFRGSTVVKTEKRIETR